MTAPARSRLRVRAPELAGRGWLNTGGRDLTLADLRGRIVVLDFWTFCCVNCLHVLDELRPLEQRYDDSLVLIGVHSPKFEHEADPDALAAAVERYAVQHPVLDDPDLVTWNAYTARAWPTLVVIDPEGYVVASLSGEGHAHGLVGPHRRAGRGAHGQGHAAPRRRAVRAGRPGEHGAALPRQGGRAAGRVVPRLRHGAPPAGPPRVRPGRPSGPGSAATGTFNEPQGVLALPADDGRGRVGYDVVVADSVHHQVKGVRLADGSVVTLAGTGRQLRERSGSGPALRQDLSTPWDLAWFLDRVVIAMAGTHQLWVLHLAQDPADNTVAVLAGTSAEGIRDGAAHDAWFAQPSGLATSADGRRLWVADSETSALRSLTLTGDGFEVTTHVGQGLFDFGHRDGAAGQALMQHPLGVTVLPDGSVAVSDTYNGAIRRFDPVTGEVGTLATGLREPSDAVVEVDGDQTRLVVVESAAHQLTRVPLPRSPSGSTAWPARPSARPPCSPAGDVTLSVAFTPPTGQKLDHRFGDPTQLMVSSSPAAFLREGGGTAQGLSRTLHLDPRVGSGILHISVRAAACDGDPVTGEVPEHAACHLYQQDWGIPVVLAGRRAGHS